MQGNELEIILIALLALSEALSLIPAVKSNSVFQLVWNVLKKVKEKSVQIKELVKDFKELDKKDKE